MTLETMEPTEGKANGSYESELNDWINHEKAAIDLIGIIGKLWFEKSIELILFRNQLVDRSASEIMNLHHYAKNIVKKVITVEDTLAIASQISQMDVCPSRLDIGKLAFEWQQESSKFKTVEDFLTFATYDLTDAPVWINTFLMWLQSDILQENWKILQFNYSKDARQLIDIIISKANILNDLRKKNGKLTAKDYDSMSATVTYTLR